MLARIIIFCLFSVGLFAEIQEVSRTKLPVIHQEMQKFFLEHITRNKMTGEIMARAMVHYINQFDPYHVYLMQDEVEPFLTMSSYSLNRLAEAYERQDYSIFEKINTQIQEAIRKLRLFRRTMVVDIERFRDLSQKSLPDITEVNQGDVGTFAKNQVELQKIHAVYMARLVGKELESYKALNRSLTFTGAVNNVELELEGFENSYLYLSRSGKSLSVSEKEQLLSLRILKALTASLDVHSEFFNSKEAQNLKMKLEKEYQGLGVGLEAGGNAFLVSSIVKGSSAAQSGRIILGDELVSIDQTKTDSLTLRQVEEMLAGKTGTYVDLGFKRDGQRPFYVLLERKQITIQEGRVDTTFTEVPGGVLGVIQLHSFYQGSGSVTSEDDVKAALKALSKRGKIKGLVLDLRDNRGGFLLQAVKVAGLFIKSGVIVAAKYSDGSLRYFRDTDPSVAYQGPLTILVSQETASAAEIVADALKDYGVAIVVGARQTYGKGSIQTQTVTGNAESGSYFKVTVGRYYSVSGNSTQFQGVTSDIVIPGFIAEKKVGEAYLSDTIKSDTIRPSYNDTLSDVPDADRAWYQHYYLPFLEQKSNKYREWIPTLEKKSKARIAANKNYQNLINGDFYLIEMHGSVNKKIPLDQRAARQTLLNMQLQEAISITKDLINLSD